MYKRIVFHGFLSMFFLSAILGMHFSRLATANPIPVPSLWMPYEYIDAKIFLEDGVVRAEVDGTYPFIYPFPFPPYPLTFDQVVMYYPIPPDADIDKITVEMDETKLDWTYSNETYLTVLGDWPMINWTIEPVPECFEINTYYEHSVPVIGGNYTFLYAMGTGRYLDYYAKNTTAYVKVSISKDVADSKSLIDVYTIRYNTTIEEWIWKPANYTITQEDETWIVTLTVVSEMFHPLEEDLLITIKAEPRTWTVDDDEPADFSKIQDAINAANPGDTIFVRAGTYYEHVTISKSVSLIGENRSTTIIDGKGAGTVVYVNDANNVNIVDFTIQNGYEGVMFMNANNNTLRDNVITSQRNGVHLFFSSSNTLSGNLISKNSGYGINLDNSVCNVLRHNNLVDNKYNFGVWGYLGNYIQDIDNSNTVNGKTTYYWVNQKNKYVPNDSGYVALVNSWNITIENLNLTENGQGLLLIHTTYSTLRNLTVSGNEIGICLISSYHNTITNSIILNNTCAGVGPSSFDEMAMQAGILFYDSDSNTVNCSTIISNNGCGVKQSYSNDNSILNSTISKNGGWGINLGNSANGILNSNFVSENGDGILLGHSNNCIITDNIVTSNRGHGIFLYNSRFSTLTRNNMTRNRYNFGVDFGAVPVEPINNVDSSNIVNGKPVYYWVKQHDRQVPADAGYVAIIESENITVSSLSLSENWQSILLAKTNNSRIERITVTNNQIGIYLRRSFGNDITKCTTSNNYHGIVVTGSQSNKFDQNNVTSNSYYGLYFFRSTNNTISCNTISLNRFGIGLYYSSNNTFQHNNFIDNEEQVEHRGTPPPSNTWDDDAGEGNYWSDYTGRDLDGDGIGDTSYSIDADNEDRYPLMGPVNVFDAGTWNNIAYHVNVASNSRVSNFYFNPDEGALIRFDVSGPDSTTGFCRVAIPKQLLSVNRPKEWIVKVDNDVVVLEVSEDENYTYLYFTYPHSTKTVIITGTRVIPEFPTWTPILLILIVLTIVIAIYKRRLSSKSFH